MAAGNGEQTTGQQQGFWKLHHAAIGLGVLLVLIFAVRSCGGDADNETVVKSESGEQAPRQAIVVQIPAPQWPAQVAPGAQQSYQPPVYVQPQIYVQPQPQPALPTADPDNPWAVQRQPAPNYGNQSVSRQSQAPAWGRQQPQQPPQYAQPPGASQYRPLDEQPRKARETRSVPTAPAPVWPAAPYDRLSGSSFGGNGTNPYAGAYPGYYGAAPYAGPGGYGARWPGVGAYGYPGFVGPRPGAW
jgi:hypothetical protein